jgi:hypothetical protein
LKHFSPLKNPHKKFEKITPRSQSAIAEMMLKIFSLFLLLFVTASLIEYANGGKG